MYTNLDTAIQVACSFNTLTNSHDFKVVKKPTGYAVTDKVKRKEEVIEVNRDYTILSHHHIDNLYNQKETLPIWREIFMMMAMCSPETLQAIVSQKIPLNLVAEYEMGMRKDK